MYARRPISAIAMFALLIAALSALFPIPQSNVFAAPTNETEPNNNFDNATPMGIGFSNYMSANINSLSDVDYFKFSVIAGQRYVVETFNVASTINSRYYPIQLDVYDSPSNPNTVTGQKFEGYGNTNASLTFEVQGSGTKTYYVRIQPYNIQKGIGAYNVRVLQQGGQVGKDWDDNHEPNNHRITAYPISVGRELAIASTFETRNASYLTNEPDKDWYRFEAKQGVSYAIETFNVASSVNILGRPLELEVYDSLDNPNSILTSGQKKPGYGNTNASAWFTANQNGTYYIEVQPYNFNAGGGSYQLRVLSSENTEKTAWDTDHEPNNLWPSAYPIQADGCPLNSNLERRRTEYLTQYHDIDSFVFNAQTGQQYTVKASRISGDFGYYGLQLEVQDKDLNVVKKTTYTSRSTLTFSATLTNKYYVFVYPDSLNGNGNYSISILPQSGAVCSPVFLPLLVK